MACEEAGLVNAGPQNGEKSSSGHGCGHGVCVAVCIVFWHFQHGSLVYHLCVGGSFCVFVFLCYMHGLVLGLAVRLISCCMHVFCGSLRFVCYSRAFDCFSSLAKVVTCIFVSMLYARAF